jgi:transposase
LWLKDCRGAGIPWRDLPSRFGDFRVIHTRFSRWSKAGVWEQVFQHLADDADNEYAMIDNGDCPRPLTQRRCKGGDAIAWAISLGVTFVTNIVILWSGRGTL